MIRMLNLDFKTGADVSTLTETTSKTLNLQLKKVDRQLSSADGSQLNVLRTCDVRIDSTYNSMNSEIYVLKSATKNILGVSELMQLDLLAVVNAMCSIEFDPVKIFSKVLARSGTLPGGFTIDMKADVQPVRLYAPRPIVAGLRQKAKEELDKTLEDGVIEPVEQATDLCSGFEIAPKSNGKIRMCVDLTNLNRVLNQRFILSLGLMTCYQICLEE